MAQKLYATVILIIVTNTVAFNSVNGYKCNSFIL